MSAVTAESEVMSTMDWAMPTTSLKTGQLSASSTRLDWRKGPRCHDEGAGIMQAEAADTEDTGRFKAYNRTLALFLALWPCSQEKRRMESSHRRETEANSDECIRKKDMLTQATTALWVVLHLRHTHGSFVVSKLSVGWPLTLFNVEALLFPHLV
jgi:hypothetical protein